tara:strand:- start:1196 stop:1858 length:663 start_codon:yes stop_codon:yes gene_type:complete
MGSIKLPHASGSGSMSIGSPSTDPSGDLELKLPATVGSADQYMKVDGSGNLGWVTPPTPPSVAFSSYAYLYERQHANTDGGSATGGNYSNYDVRVLNNEEDSDGIVSLASNQFTLGAGTYFIQFCVPGYKVDVFNAKLYNTTDGSDVKYSNTMKSNNGGTDHSVSVWGATTVTIGASKTFEIRQHNQTSFSGAGLGFRSGYSENTGTNSSIYTQVWIFKA